MRISRSTVRLVLKWSALGLAGLLTVALLTIWLHMRRSLPQLEGEVHLPGLEAAVTVERDAQGVPTIHAESRLDAARALGFLHAQDRFFAMDLNRRSAAGELAALAGAAALEYDRYFRLFPGRELAQDAIATMPAEDRALLDAYTLGVNAGLEALAAAPPEYILPGFKAEPWLPEDCVLVGLSMYFNLQDSRGEIDEARALVRRHLPAEVVRYLFERTPEWDTPLDASVDPVPPLPVEAWAQAIAAAEEPAASPLPEMEPGDEPTPGSNAWAATGEATPDGRAILANDMHLGLRVPHIWYRVSLRYRAEDGSPVEIDGPTFPGGPVHIVGSNRHLAWGFTNSYTDQTDLVALELHPDDPGRYRTPDGWTEFTLRRETIEVAMAETVEHEVRETIWGPVREGRDGTLYAVIWMGNRRGMWNMGLDRLATARSVEEATDIAHRTTVPTQNLVLADRTGSIAWTLVGPLPDRAGADGFFPLTAETIGNAWEERLPPDAYPVIAQPAGGRIWTANQRLVGGDHLVRLGDGGYDEAYRARTIREALHAEALDEPGHLALQGNIRPVHMADWQALFLDVLDDEALAADDARRTHRELLAAWEGEAAAESVAYYHLVLAKDTVRELIRRHLALPLGEHAGAFPPSAGVGLDEIALEILRTPHAALIPPRYDSASDLVLTVLDMVAASAGSRPWGDYNALAMEHPLFGNFPLIGRWFNMPSVPQPGDSTTVRVLRPANGSSQRMVVAPGREEDGFYHQPAGPSGHFLSPYFRAGHRDWVDLAPSPFLPGAPAHTLRLLPASESGRN